MISEFAFVDFKLLFQNVDNFYKVAVLLTNCHSYTVLYKCIFPCMFYFINFCEIKKHHWIYCSCFLWESSTSSLPHSICHLTCLSPFSTDNFCSSKSNCLVIQRSLSICPFTEESFLLHSSLMLW